MDETPFRMHSSRTAQKLPIIESNAKYQHTGFLIGFENIREGLQGLMGGYTWKELVKLGSKKI